MEVVNRTLGNLLCCLVQDQPKSWDDVLIQAELAFNFLHNFSIGRSPFSIVYTKIPNPIVDVAVIPKCTNKAISTLAE